MSGTVHLARSRALPRPRAQTLALIGVVALALAVRLYHLGQTSLWTDEFFTEFYPKTGLGFMWGQGLRLEPTPPLYDSLILLIERLFGESAFLLRLPSLLGSMAGIALAGLLARELFGPGARVVWTVLLLALCPTDIFYAQEARAYALQGAALALALLGFARMLRDPRSTAALAIYGAGAVLAVYLHLTSSIAVAAINVAFLAGFGGRTALLDRKALWRWAAVNVLVVLACLPLLPGVLSPATGAATSWIEGINRWYVQLVIGQTLFGPALTDQAKTLAEVGVAILAALLLLPPWRPDRRTLIVLGVAPAVFLALMVVVSLKKPVLLDRTVAWVWLPLAIVLADVVVRRGRVIAAGVLALFIAGAGLHLREVDGLKEDWRGLLARLPDLGGDTLVVLAPGSSPAALALYAPQVTHDVLLDAGEPATVETTVIPALFGTERIGVGQLRDAIASGRPVWVLTRRREVETIEKAIAGLPPPTMVVTDTASPRAMRAMRW